jgi:hypothetical protein
MMISSMMMNGRVNRNITTTIKAALTAAVEMSGGTEATAVVACHLLLQYPRLLQAYPQLPQACSTHLVWQCSN